MGRSSSKKGFSFKLYQKLADNSYVVSLVLRFNKQRHLINLSFSAFPEQWDDARERYIDNNAVKEISNSKELLSNERKKLIQSLHPDREVNNIYLDKKATEIRDIIDDFERRKIPFTNSMVKERLFVTINASTVEKYLISHIDELKRNKRFGTATTFEDLYTCLKRSDRDFSKRLFPDIDYKYVSQYFENEKEKGRKVGGIGVNLRALRSLLNEAIKENVGSPETYPFSNQYGTRTGKDTFGLSTKVKTITRKRFIPIDLLQKFYNYEFDSIPHQRSKGLFFFSFFCGGINFADMAMLKYSDIKSGFDRENNPIKYFMYVRSKTKEAIEIQINDDIQSQIEYLQNSEFGVPVNGYLLPIITKEGMSLEGLNEFKINKRKKLNKYLKEMAVIVGFPESLHDLSTYFARHSFAMRLFSKTKSIDVVSAGLRHANTEITKVYLESFGKDEIARMSCGLLD